MEILESTHTKIETNCDEVLTDSSSGTEMEYQTTDGSIEILAMKLDHQETKRLIQTYRNFPILWNPKMPHAHSLKAKRKAVQSMAQILTDKYLIPMDVNIVRQKIKNIRNQYKTYLRKREEGLPTNLWYMPQLDDFLGEHIHTSLRLIEKDKMTPKILLSLDLPFRFKENLTLNVSLIDALRNASKLWRNERSVFQVNTEMLRNMEFHKIRHALNRKHDMQLDENNLLLLLHDLSEWLRRERLRQKLYRERSSDGAAAAQEDTFRPSSQQCWESIQFLAEYTILPGSYKCDICAQSTKSIQFYLSDRAKHAGTMQLYKCFYCDRRFADIANCRTHECRIHSKIYNYACEFCDRKFAHSTDARSHRRRMHTRERRFICEVCGYCFVSGYELKRHRLKHSRSPEYKCTVCHLEFVMLSELNNHKRNYHTTQCNSKKPKRQYHKKMEGQAVVVKEVTAPQRAVLK